MPFDFTSYRSPFSWRYGSREMRRIWSELHKYELWRTVWVELARAQHHAGLVTHEELRDLEAHRDEIDIGRILALEKETKHDVVAAIREFAEKALVGGGKIHLGATSADIVDNADMMRVREAMEIIMRRVDALLRLFAEKITNYASLPCIGYTHLQPAEPTTVGYRLAFSAQDLLLEARAYQFIKKNLLKGKGMKGAVGTRANYGVKAEQIDTCVAKSLGFDTFLITGQVYPRNVDFWLLSLLAGIAGTLSKFATDVRFLQTPAIGEWSESFGKSQVGSSAMPFKKNPINSEKICSLARYIVRLPDIALENASVSFLERTLDDSANRRLIIPEAFLALDEILTTAQKVLESLVINKERIAYNLVQFGPFAATEVVIIEAVKRGANRQDMHELLRTVSMRAWQEVQAGKPNPMEKLLVSEKKLAVYLLPNEIHAALDVSGHTGDAPERARKLAGQIIKTIHHE